MKIAKILQQHGLHRLVVRTSRCGRDNPGSTPGVDISRLLFCSHGLGCEGHSGSLWVRVFALVFCAGVFSNFAIEKFGC